MVVKLVEKYGPKRWSLIASQLKGRIGKQCRERYVTCELKCTYVCALYTCARVLPSRFILPSASSPSFSLYLPLHVHIFTPVFPSQK